jgi:hypothetical protein
MPVEEMKHTAYNVKYEKDYLFKVCSKLSQVLSYSKILLFLKKN